MTARIKTKELFVVIVVAIIVIADVPATEPLDKLLRDVLRPWRQVKARRRFAGSAFGAGGGRSFGTRGCGGLGGSGRSRVTNDLSPS
jgi:hypothetical protein